MRPRLRDSLTLMALLPCIAACAGPAASARLDLKDACVWSPAPAENTDLRDRLPTGTMVINHFEVPFQLVNATLIPRHKPEPVDNCDSGHIG